MITQDETNVLTILTNSVQQLNNEFQRQLAARKSYIQLLEDKYESTFDEVTGQLKKKV
jgi:hypothetical protein